MKSPLTSVITITLNAEKYLEQTILSVLSQTYENIEYIVIDGGSTDGTLGIIEKYKDRIAHFISEKDDGIADAMNKGVALATGEYVIFLHSDDYFAGDDALKTVVDTMDESADIIACGILFGEELKYCKPVRWNWWLNIKGIPHQGTLTRISLFKEFDGFDTQFDVCMDYDFFLRAYRNQANIVKSPAILTVMREGGISSRRDWESLKIRFEEERRVHRKNSNSSYLRLFYRLYWLLYLPYRSDLHSMERKRRVKEK